MTTDENPKRDAARKQVELIKTLVELRRARNLKQEDIAKRIGRSRSTVSDFERLSGDPRLSTMCRYADAMGVNLTWAVNEHHDQQHNATAQRKGTTPQ